MAKVTALTTSSRITALINLRMMYENTGMRRRCRGPVATGPRTPMPSPAFQGCYFLTPMLR